MEIIINILDVLLVFALGYAIWSYIPSRKCSDCGQPLSNGDNYCARCGAVLSGGEKNKAVVYLDKHTILRRVYIVMFIYVVGMPLLWLLSIFEIAAAPTLMVVFALYAIVGALVIVLLYRKLSKCPACNSFVSVHHDESWSANYCENCGVRIEAQQGTSANQKTARRFSDG